MTPTTKKLLFTLIRLGKGMLKACELWLQDQQSVDGESSAK